jgi:N-acetylglutamate synthase-like GNAT family acetyltransferase
MPRPAAHIRDATPADAAELLDLLGSSAADDDAFAVEVHDAELALTNLATQPDERLLVVECGGRLVASMQMRRAPVSPVSLDSVVHTSFLVVAPQHRRHGYAHLLMEAAVGWAEEKDIQSVTAITNSDRDTNRFFARLGLVGSANVRHAPTSALRKKLSADRSRVAVGGNRHLVEVLAQRRSMRRRQASA